jgi:hypothetical protein
MNWLSWILFAACCVICFAIGWAAGGWRREVAEFREEDERNDRWDRVHLRGGSKLAPGADPKPVRPAAPPAGWPQ